MLAKLRDFLLSLGITSSNILLYKIIKCPLSLFSEFGVKTEVRLQFILFVRYCPELTL